MANASLKRPSDCVGAREFAYIQSLTLEQIRTVNVSLTNGVSF